MSAETPTVEVDLLIRRTLNVRDGHGNSFGIIDVSPDVDDPAVLLGVRSGRTGQRLEIPLRPGQHVRTHDFDLRVTAMQCAEPAWLRVTGSVPLSEEAPS